MPISTGAGSVAVGSLGTVPGEGAFPGADAPFGSRAAGGVVCSTGSSPTAVRASWGSGLAMNQRQTAPLRRFSPLSKVRSEEHTSELQSRSDLVCRLLLEKKKI